MLEIEKLGLVEMDSQQVNEVDGGFLPIAVVVAIWAIEVAACCSLMHLYANVKKK